MQGQKTAARDRSIQACCESWYHFHFIPMQIKEKYGNLRVQVPREENLKHKSYVVLYHHQKWVEVEAYDQMARMQSIKAINRWWHVHVFYNIIGLAWINRWGHLQGSLSKQHQPNRTRTKVG